MSQNAEATVGGGLPGRKVYRVGAGRRLFFSFVFIILLPFLLSLPGMLFMRLQHGQTADAIGLAIFAVMFSILMLLIFAELLFAVRARVEIGEERLRATLPSGRGPTPMLRYKSYDIPYDQVHTIETRREVYGGALLPVLLKGARLTLKDGSNVRLGYVSETCVDPTFPYPEIAQGIAERARLPVIDRGNVRRSYRRKMLGLKGALKSGSDVVEEKHIEDLNRSHANVMMGLIGGLVVLMLVGLVEDFSAREPEPRPGLMPALSAQLRGQKPASGTTTAPAGKQVPPGKVQ